MTTTGVRGQLAVGDRVRFDEDKPTVWYCVRGVTPDGRFAVCTRPYNPRRTVIYTIVDFERDVRGPDNLVFGFGYETDEDIALALTDLASGEREVSYRTSRHLPLHIADVRRAKI